MKYTSFNKKFNKKPKIEIEIDSFAESKEKYFILKLKEGIDIKLVRKEIVSIDKADKSDIVGLGYTDLKNVYKVYREADLNILRKKDYVEDCIPIISYRSGQAIEETSAQKSISVKKDLVERAIEGENLQEENE